MMRAKRKGSTIPKGLDCRDCPNRYRTEWAALSDNEMRRVRNTKTPIALQRGHYLFAQGQVHPGVFCLFAGTVAITKKDNGTGTVFLRLAHAGQILGFRNHINRSVCTTSAKILEPCTVCHIDGEVFAGLLRENPELEKQFLRGVVAELDSTESTMAALASLPVRSRLARFLIALARRYSIDQPADDMEVRAPMTWRDMSELIYTRPETLTRTVQAMENEGVFRHKGHSIHIARFEDLMEEGNLN